MPYFPNVLLLHLVPLDHRFPLEETAVFVVVESLLAEKVGLLFSLGVLQVLFMFGYSFLLLFLGRAVVLVHLLRAYRVKTRLPLGSQCHRTWRTLGHWLLPSQLRTAFTKDSSSGLSFIAAGPVLNSLSNRTPNRAPLLFIFSPLHS